MKFTKLIIYFWDIADKFNHDVLVLFSILVSIIEIDGFYAEIFLRVFVRNQICKVDRRSSWN